MTQSFESIGKINLIVTHAYGRAGSLFIQSLFDGHPDVLTLPHFGSLYSKLPEMTTGIERAVDDFIADYPAIFDTARGYFGNVGVTVSGKFGPRGDEDLFVDRNIFKKTLLNLADGLLENKRPASRKDLFALIHLAYALCLRDFDVSEIKYIFYHPHTNDEWGILLRDYPRLYFIAMTRDPRQDWASWKKLHAIRMGREASNIPPICLFLSEYKLSRNCRTLGDLIGKLEQDHVRIIDLEQFHVMNRAAMRYLCGWLNVAFGECLMQSTFNGRQWSGNSKDLVRSTSFNPEMKLASWREELSGFEKNFIDRLLFGTIRFLRYEADGKKNGEPFAEVPAGLNYESGWLLFAHCFLYAAGSPFLVFSGIERSRSVAQAVKRVVGNLASLARAVPSAFALFREFKGDGLKSSLLAVAVQEESLFDTQLPSRLFVSHGVGLPQSHMKEDRPSADSRQPAASESFAPEA